MSYCVGPSQLLLLLLLKGIYYSIKQNLKDLGFLGKFQAPRAVESRERASLRYRYLPFTTLDHQSESEIDYPTNCKLNFG